MTDHTTLKMHREKVRISDKDMLCAILDMEETCCVALHDEPYPYIVPMNYGYEWEDKLVFYFHMAIEGHRIELIKKNPRVAVSVWTFLDRVGHDRYRKESHDYRSVTAFGTAEIISPEQEEAYIHGMSVLCVNSGRPAIKRITTEMRQRLFVLKVTADVVTGKAQYPISTVEEVCMPPLQKDGQPVR